MFSLYGLSGPIFTGELGALARQPQITRRRPTTATRVINGEDAPATTEGFVLTAAPSASLAAEAYQAMLPEELDRGPLYQADQIMRSPVISVNADDEVARAWQALVDHQIRQAPVLDVGGRLVGIVSERNLLTALNVDDQGKVRDVMSRRVADVMTTPVVAAHPFTDIRQIASVMLEGDVDGVPIVNEQGLLSGFVSRSDILNAVVTNPPLSLWR